MHETIVARTVIFSCHSLAGKGDAVHEVAVEVEQLLHQGVNSQHDVATQGASTNEEEIHRQHEHAAHEDVAAHLEEAATALEVEGTGKVQLAHDSGKAMAHAPAGVGHAHPHRRESAHGNALEAHVEHIDRHQAHHHVEHVHAYGDEHRAARVLHAQQPPFYRHRHEYGGSAPHHYAKVGTREGSHLVAWCHYPQQQPLDGCLKQHDYGTGYQRNGTRALQRVDLSAVHATAIGLCREPRRAHAQEPQIPVQHVHHHRAHCHCAYILRRTQVASDARIEQSQQRLGNVGNYRRQRYRNDFSIYL